MFDKIFSSGKTEQKVIDLITTHIRTLNSACEHFQHAISSGDIEYMLTVIELEREGDSIRRDIISHIYEGAFLPFLRPSLCRFVEIIDEAFDIVEDAAFEFENVFHLLDQDVRGDCVEVAKLNLQMSDMLHIAFGTLFTKDDLREKTLAIRILEKKVDEIKFDLIKKLRQKKIATYWDGKSLSDFITALTSVSDTIEDASDYLYIIDIRLR